MMYSSGVAIGLCRVSHAGRRARAIQRIIAAAGNTRCSLRIVFRSAPVAISGEAGASAQSRVSEGL